MEGYIGPERSSYLHLVDGGIADNLGVRGPLDEVVEAGGMWTRFEDAVVENPRSNVFIVVDSSTNPKKSFMSVPGAPSIAAMLGSVTNTQLHRYNFETKALLMEKMEDWAKDMASHGVPMTSHFIDLAEYGISDPAERKFFNSVPTALTLDAETVDRLIALGRKLLRDSEEFQRLLAELEDSRETLSPSTP
jgi:NTE family protein